jgi:4-amino-4-deoxy-L-arabinose transferase-like glycosyltransferase
MKQAMWKKWAWPSLLVCPLIVLYSYSSPSTVTMEDSGIFLVSSFFLGIPQPTGYPFYTILAWAFSNIPIGSITSRVVLLNSLLGAFSCLLVYFIVFRLTNDKPAALISAILLGLSTSFWHQAIVAEVYMLNAFLFLLVLYLCLELRRSYNRKMLAFLSIAYGLGLANHFPLLILASGALSVLLWKIKREILKDIWIAVIFLILGLLPYIHLLTAHCFSQFLFLSPIENLSDLWSYLSRKNYLGIDVFKTYSIIHSLSFAFFFVSNLIKEFSPVAFPLIILGLVDTWFIKDKTIPIALLLAVLSSSIFLLIPWRTEFTNLTRDFYQYCQLIPLVICSILFGYGLAFLRGIIDQPDLKSNLIVSAVGVICVAWAFYGNFQVNNLRNDTFADDYAKLIINHLPENAVLLLNDDADHGPVGYVHFVEGVRPDLLVTSQVGVIFPVKPFDSKKHPEYKDRRVPVLNFISRHLKEGRRVFTTEKLRYFNNETARFPLSYRSHGLYYEIVEKTAEPIINTLLVKDSLLIMDKYESGGYQKQWSFHRDAVIGKISKLLFEAGQYHPVLDSHLESLLIHAQIENVHYKNYQKADELFSRVIGQTTGLYLARQLEVYRQFLVNRINWTNSADMPPARKKDLIQEAANFSFPMAKKYPFCDNVLALNLIQITRQMPIDIDEGYFRETFHDCEWFQPYLN